MTPEESVSDSATRRAEKIVDHITTSGFDKTSLVHFVAAQIREAVEEAKETQCKIHDEMLALAYEDAAKIAESKIGGLDAVGDSRIKFLASDIRARARNLKDSDGPKDSKEVK